MEQRKQRVRGWGFLFACESQSLSSPSTLSTQAQDAARLRLIKGNKCYSDSQRVEPTHGKCPWIFAFLSLVVQMSCRASITRRFSCPLNTYKQGALSTLYSSAPHSEFFFFENGQKKNVKICLLSLQCQSLFKCQAVPVLSVWPFPPDWQMSRTGISYF